MRIVENQNLSFEAPGKDVVAAFTRVKSVVSYVKADDAKFVIAVMESAVFAIGISTDAMACIKIANSIAIEDGVIGIDADLLIGVSKTRGPMKFNVEGKLKLSEIKGRYTSSIEIIEFDDKDVAILQQYLTPTKAAALSSEQIALLKQGVKQVELQNFFSDEELLALIDVRDQCIYISCFDNYHIAQYTYKTESEAKLRMALPTKAFAMIDKFIGSGKAKFESASGRLRVAGPEFILSIPETQVDDEAYSQVSVYKKSLKDPATSFVFNTAAVDSVENMFALVDKDTKMAMRIGKSEVAIEVSTARGSVADSFTSEITGDKQNIHIDPRIFMDLFKKVKDKKNVPLNLYHIKGVSSCFAFKTKSDKATLTLIGSFETEVK